MGQRAVPRGECLNSPYGLKMLSPTEKSRRNNSIGAKSATGGKEAETLVGQEESTHADLWVQLIGRANEDQIFINGYQVTALLDTGSQVTHVSQDFCLAKGIQIQPISQLVNIERMGGSIEYVGYIEAKLSLHMESHIFDIEALLLVLPTTDYQKRGACSYRHHNN